MTTHVLKTNKTFFIQLWKRVKTAELRKDDRQYRVGDRLHLYWFTGQPAMDECGQWYVAATVSAITKHRDYPEGLKRGYVMLSLTNMTNHCPLDKQEGE
jgi:hypothetical protein